MTENEIPAVPSAPRLDGERLYREHGEAVLRLAREVSGNAADARDLTQDCFVKALRELAQGAVVRHPRAWLLRIVMTGSLDCLRRRRGWVPLNWEAVEAAPEPTPLKAMLNREAAAAVTAAVDGLPPEMRALLHLKYEEGMRNAEIADVLGISRNLVTVRLVRAKSALKTKLRGSHARESE